MTQDETIKLACQTFGGIIKKEERKNFLAFAKLVAEHEREKCAKEVENALYGQEGCGKAAKAIRLRGES